MKNSIDTLEELSNFIFTSKYARYNEKEKRRETWAETISRCKNMHLEHYSFLPKKDKDEITWAFEQVEKGKLAVPSMRSMQFGGIAVEAHNARMFNCLSKETQFITKGGVKSFEDFKHGDETLVLTHKGNWKNATVKCYGTDDLYPITVTRCKNKQVIYATKDHRWILKDGTFTSSLSEGQTLRGAEDIFSLFNYNEASPLEKLYWCYGYVFGDGTVVTSGKNQYSMVRLCKSDSVYHKRFEEMGFSTSTPLSCGGDFFAYTGSYLKSAPNPEVDSPNLIRAFVAGYCDADAAKNRNSTINYNTNNVYNSIQATGQKHINFIRTCFPIAGIYLVSEEDLTGQETNFGVRNEITKRFRIFNAPNNKENSNTPFVVSSIGRPKKDEVWCLEVEDDESFVFPTGLVTGKCSVRHVDSIRSFAEVFYLLLCGCGVGIGLSKQFLDRLPYLVDTNDKTGTVITYVCEDKIESWADSVEALLNCYFKNTPYSGRKIVFDYSRIRPAGSILKTGGGKAPGHKGLKNAHLKIKQLLDYIIEEQGQIRLKSINAYDILMHCADAVLSGGIRRSACSVVCQKDDTDLINSKINFTVTKYQHFEENTKNGKWEGVVYVDGQYGGRRHTKYEVSLSKFEYDLIKEKKQISWIHIEPQRARSNNSVLMLRNSTTLEEFANIVERAKQWGDPGFVWADDTRQLFNPCFEIGFIPVTEDGVCGVMFCNLTSQNGAAIKTKEQWKNAVKAATIIGTLQAGYTNFPYLGHVAEKLTREEALLGVSITGMMDNPDLLLNEELQKELAKYACQANEEWADKLGINAAARVTCIKPEGTSSLVLKSASGIHPHHARRYFRRVQCNKLDNVYKFFKKHNPHMCEESIWSANKTDDVICFPIEVSEKAIVKDDLDAIKHLGIILNTQKNWVVHGTSKYNAKPITHNVSCTVKVGNDEWDKVINFIYHNRMHFAAVSLLPETGDKDFKQAPNEKITPKDEEKWNSIISNMKSVDYTKLLESDDNTVLKEEVACAGGACLL